MTEEKKEKLEKSEFIASQFMDLHYKKGTDGFEPCPSEEKDAVNIRLEKGDKIPTIFVHNFLLYARQNILNLEHKEGLPFITDEQIKKYKVNFKEEVEEKKPKTYAKYTMEKLLARWSKFKDKFGKEGDEKFKLWAEDEFGVDEIDRRKTPRAVISDIRKIVG